MLGVVGAGLAAAPGVGAFNYAANSLFFEQFSKIEPRSLWVIAGSVAMLLVAMARPGAGSPELPSPRYRAWIIALLACAVAAITLGGIRWIFHGYLLADDEYAMWFQSLIFAHGDRVATVSREWCPYITALAPDTTVPSADCSWFTNVLPIHSLIQAPFIALGVGRLGMPLMAGACTWLTASIARKLWPERPARAYVAAVFMATSTQLLFMSMTMFAMTTHLFFSLVWLWLYVDDRRWSNVLLPLWGVLALGVHSPFPHAFLIPPFVLRYLWRRRYAMFGYVSVVYALGLMFWLGYLHRPHGAASAAVQLASPAATVQAGTSVFQLPTAFQGLITALHLALIPSWNAPLAIILAVAAMLSWRRLDAFSRDAVLSILFVIAARMLVPTTQGVGWGYRFVFSGLGLFALLAAIGTERLAEAVGSRRTIALIAACSAAALCVQIPLRAADVDRIVGPYRRGFDWLSSRDYDAVVFPVIYVAWGRPLVRNSPYLENRPKILSSLELTQDQLQTLTRNPALRVKVLERDSVFAHGFPHSIIKIGGMWVVQ